MVTPPHRDGGQRQYRERPHPSPGTSSLSPVLAWLEANLHKELTVRDMADHAHLSPRTFARRFLQETGTTPLQWLTTQRVLLAQHHLETTSDPVRVVARRSGFATVDTLRHHFTRRVGTTPAAYRRTFHHKPSTKAEPNPSTPLLSRPERLDSA
jgi:transcriptional regulator GlxA family with amidase domain